LFFLLQLAVGTALISVTVIVHISGLVGILKLTAGWAPRLGPKTSFIGMMEPLLIMVVGLFLLHTLEIWIWAVFYILLGEFSDIHRALYFSTVTFSTLGYGDIVLTDRWDLVSSFEAVNGIILFGISTAFAFSFLQRVHAAIAEGKS